MSIWMEVFCNIGSGKARCHNYRDEINPGAESSDSDVKEFGRKAGELHKLAKGEGWKFTKKHGWVCPACFKGVFGNDINRTKKN